MDVKTTFRNLVRDQSVSICMLHAQRHCFQLNTIPICTVIYNCVPLSSLQCNKNNKLYQKERPSNLSQKIVFYGTHPKKTELLYTQIDLKLYEWMIHTSRHLLAFVVYGCSKGQGKRRYIFLNQILYIRLLK